MHHYYLVRRIMPNNCLPTFQLVFCDSDRQKVENHLELIQMNPQLSHKFTSYSIEMHPSWISNQELNRRHLGDRKVTEVTQVTGSNVPRNFNYDPDDPPREDEVMSEITQPFI
jgi:hypothetical protein